MCGEIGTLTTQPWILTIADIVPRPAIECALAYRRREVRRQVVAQSVTFVHHAPQRAAARLDRFTRAVAQAGREDMAVTAIRIEDQHVGAVLLAAPPGTDAVRGFPARQRGGITPRQARARIG